MQEIFSFSPNFCGKSLPRVDFSGKAWYNIKTDAKKVKVVSVPKNQNLNDPASPFYDRRAQAESYLGKTVGIEIDRPIGYYHRKADKSWVYPVNYGFIPGVLGGDGEELDVYLLGVDHVVDRYDAEIIAYVHRFDDNEDKLIGAPAGMRFSKEEIERSIDFQERYHSHEIVVAN